MTIDDENSIYVGGIRYDCTEDDLRHAFELFGSILAVKVPLFLPVCSLDCFSCFVYDAEDIEAPALRPSHLPFHLHS